MQLCRKRREPMTNREAVNWLINITADIGKAEHRDLWHYEQALSEIREMLEAQPEPLTDKEQRIFLAAMGREEKICEEVDRNYVREPYEDTLVGICREIRRKVKGALWSEK